MTETQLILMRDSRETTFTCAFIENGQNFHCKMYKINFATAHNKSIYCIVLNKMFFTFDRCKENNTGTGHSGRWSDNSILTMLPSVLSIWKNDLVWSQIRNEPSSLGRDVDNYFDKDVVKYSRHIKLIPATGIHARRIQSVNGKNCLDRHYIQPVIRLRRMMLRSKCRSRF